MIPGYLGVPYVDGVCWTLAIELKLYAIVLIGIAVGKMEHVERYLLAWLLGLTTCEVMAVRGVVASALMYASGAFLVAGWLLFQNYRYGIAVRRTLLLAWASLLAAANCARNVSEFVTAPNEFDVLVAACAEPLFALATYVVAIGKWTLSSVESSALAGRFSYPLYLLHNEIGKVVLALGSLARVLGADLQAPSSCRFASSGLFRST